MNDLLRTPLITLSFLHRHHCTLLKTLFPTFPPYSNALRQFDILAFLVANMATTTKDIVVTPPTETSAAQPQRPASPLVSPTLSPASLVGSMYSAPTISPEVNGLNETLAAMKGSLGNLGVRVCFLDLLYFTECSDDVSHSKCSIPWVNKPHRWCRSVESWRQRRI